MIQQVYLYSNRRTVFKDNYRKYTNLQFRLQPYPYEGSYYRGQTFHYFYLYIGVSIIEGFHVYKLFICKLALIADFNKLLLYQN